MDLVATALDLLNLTWTGEPPSFSCPDGPSRPPPVSQRRGAHSVNL